MDVVTFFSTLLSYFVILVLGGWLLLCFVLKKLLNPVEAGYGVIFMGGRLGLALLFGLPILLAFVSRVDPLGWLWKDIADWITWALTENPDVL